ncbi:nascent polypeptide-associated complex subunit alpha, muscle-specific form-like [Zingiber officinale]|uniref:nascent polypeptide-associated complex subunit alpha, muscle-specific form-like n=1 Tax=Zingiber officinale TaxID=94328 RepID=UPI001C4D53BF|nr:nascent polypeptide-associated complex subunit alpha, muscle-specific form-like [Zingiber officinale]
MLEGILYTFGLSLVPAEIGAPFAAAILRSFACQETPAVAVLEALHEELTPGLPSDPAAAFDPQLPAPPTSDVVIAPPLAVLPSPSAADPALSHTSDQPATASSPTRQAPPLRPTLRLRVTRNSKRTAPVTATSPPPSQRQRVVVLSSPSKSSGTSSAQETSLGQEQAYDLEVAGPPSDRLTTVPLQSVLPAPPSPSGGQPLDSLTPPASSPLIPMSSVVPISEPPSPDWAFRALWRLPSATDPANVPAATSSPFFGRVDFHGALANSWQSAHRQFWESEYPLEELDQVACSLVATCSASLSVVQRAAELERENVALKACLRELEPPSSSTAPSEPSLEGLDSCLHAAGESAASTRALSDAAFNKLRALEAALKAELSRAQEAVSQGQSDLAAARAEATQDKDAMAEYLAGELGRLKAYRLAYVRSSFFLQKLGRWMVVLLSYGAAGGVRQAFEQGYLRVAPPATFLDTTRLARELPQDTFHSFEADDGLFFQAAPPPAAAPTPVEVSPQDLPAAIPEASEALAPPPAEPADPASPRSAPDNLSPPYPNVV